MTETQEAMAKLQRDIPADGLAVAIQLTIRIHQNGAMSVEGPTGDPAFCKKMLDEAWFAIKRNQKQSTLIIPEKDLDSRPKESYLA